MANGIKFSSIEEGALRIGNANIAVRQNSVSNPSSYWTSIEPVNGGYTVYIDKPENGPAVYNANSDAELIALGNKLSGQSFANINQCLTWFNTYEEGNRNLIIGSKQIDIGGTGTDYSTYTTHTNTTVNGFLESTTTVIIADPTRCYRYRWLQGYYSEYPKSDTDYIYSFDYKNNNPNSQVWLDVRGTFGTLKAQVSLQNTNGVWQRGYLLFNKSFINSTNSLTGVRAGTQIGDYTSIRKIKLERGSVATPWRPAMEDPDYVLDKFVLHSEIPQIVTDGLVLNYDAGLIPSYPRGGTVINDVSGNGNNGTLVNGVGYSSDGGGSLSFDATNDHINATNVNLSTITNGTICFWGKNIGNSEWLFMTGNTTNYYIFATYNGVNFYNANCGFPTYYVDGIQTGVPPSDNNWHYMVATNVNLSTWNTFIIGQYSGTSYKYNGYINDIKFYNRSLTQQEILQNYYAGLQKFIPKDGLVLSLSPQNSYFSGSAITSVRDISGNGNDGSINNGVAYVREGGGSWLFDGINDHITRNPINVGNVFTYNFWIKPTTKTRQCVCSNSYAYSINKGFLIACPGNSSTQIFISLGRDQKLAISNTAIISNKWQMVTCRVNGSAELIKIYINGIEVSTYNGQTDANIQLEYDVGNLLIGYWANTDFFNSNLGQVMLYNRALTTTEISTIYQATKSKYV